MIAKVVVNHKQSDIQNMKQSVDILKRKSYDKTSKPSPIEA